MSKIQEISNNNINLGNQGILFDHQLINFNHQNQISKKCDNLYIPSKFGISVFCKVDDQKMSS